MKRKFTAKLCSALSLLLLFSCSKNQEKKILDDVKNHHVIITYLTTGNKPSDSGTSEMLEKLNARLTQLVNAELEI